MPCPPRCSLRCRRTAHIDDLEAIARAMMASGTATTSGAIVPSSNKKITREALDEAWSAGKIDGKRLQSKSIEADRDLR